MPLKNTFSQHSFLKTTKYNRDGIRRSKSSNFPTWCFLEENRIEERGGGEGFVSHRSCSMTISTSCPLVIANRTCLSRYPPSSSWKRRIKAGRKRRTEATSLDVQRRSLNRSTGLRMRYYRPLACQLYLDLFAAHRVSVALNFSTTPLFQPCLHRSKHRSIRGKGMFFLSFRKVSVQKGE